MVCGECLLNVIVAAGHSTLLAPHSLLSFQVVMSFLKLGVISLFLSDALISGYTAAAAFVIVVTQLAPLLGMRGADSTVDPGLFVTPRVREGEGGRERRWKGEERERHKKRREGICLDAVCFYLFIFVYVCLSILASLQIFG